MRTFEYLRAAGLDEAIRAGSAEGASYVAGCTNLVDLMKYGVARPTRLVDINGLCFHGIEELDGGGLRLGALARNSETAYYPAVRARYPLLSHAILAGASAQLRNAATNGGNLNQRTRCYYFYDASAPCNKRQPGSGCGARGGINRIHAILGASDACIATHPSDMCVALLALDATVEVTGPAGARTIAFGDYHRLPGEEPWRDNTLEPGELVTAIDLPKEGFAGHYTYLKMRDRQSYAFALVSVGIGMTVQDGCIAEARIALGGVAHKPWRRPGAERLLTGRAVADARYDDVADAILDGARGQGGNNFKLALARRAIHRACVQAAAGTPQSLSDKRIA